MASSRPCKRYLVAAVIHPGVDPCEHQGGFIDKQFANVEVELVNHNKIPAEKQVLVEGVWIYGLHFAINAQFMDLYPNLRVVSCTSSGTEHVDLIEATKRGIKVGNTVAEVREGTADLAFGLLIASARTIVKGDFMGRQPDFNKIDVGFFGKQVFGSTLGIIGLGGIGTAVAKRAKGFGMTILYFNRTRKHDIEEKLGVIYCENLTDLLNKADFVVLSISLTAQTRHLIAAAELTSMKPTATLINVSRGDIVNQDDLVTALRTKQIHAAALDVTTPEPLPRDHPLLTLDNVIITPHVGTATKECRQSMVAKSVSNLISGLRGEPLPSPAN